VSLAVHLADIARAAGLSPSTISRALSDPEKVSAATRDKVHRIARDLGYVPNQTPRSRTDVLGVIVPDISNPFFPPVVKAIQARAHARGKLVLLADVDEHAVDEIFRARTLQPRVDGLIIVSPRSSDDVLNEIAATTRTVFVHRLVEGAANVVIDDAVGIGEAVQHLAALGHRRLGYLNGPNRSWSNGRRRTALQSACTAHSVDLVEFGPFEPQMQAGARAADLVIATDLTGVIAYDDLVALGFMVRLNERGVRPGTDLSVIGIDNSPMAAISYPPLTSVHVPGAAAGAIAVDVLLDLLAEPDERPATSSVIGVETNLVVRASTAVALAR
jgi:DNA-binding LacI/PurR family transcriptional regulator